MALSRTHLVGSISNTTAEFGTGNYTSGSFTPPDSSLIVVGLSCIENGGSTNCQPDLTLSGGSLTWTKRVGVGADTSYSTATQIWTAPVSTGASMTLVASCSPRSIAEYTISAVAYTGYDTTTPVGATASGSQVGGWTGPPDPYSITLSAAPASTSEVFAIAGIDKSVANASPGSTFTEIDDFCNTTYGGAETEVRTGSTSTTVDWVDVRAGGGALFNVAAAAIEIRASAAAGSLVPPRGWRRHNGLYVR